MSNQRIPTETIRQSQLFMNYGISTCVICLGNFTNLDECLFLFPCSHNVEEDCFKEYIKNANGVCKCPLCNQEIQTIMFNDQTHLTPQQYKDNNYQRNLLDDEIAPPSILNTVMRFASSSIGYTSRCNSSAINYASDYENIHDTEFIVKPSIQVESNLQRNTGSEIKLFWDKREDENKGIVVVTTPSDDQLYNTDILIAIDNSGSMSGNKIEICKSSLKLLITMLKDGQRLSLFIFDDIAVQLIELRPIKTGDLSTINKIIDGIKAHGGTNYRVIWQALAKVSEEAKSNSVKERDLTVIWLTDGEPGEDVTLKVVDDFYEANPNVSFNIISLGAGVNSSKLLPKLKYKGDTRGDLGTYVHCSTVEEIQPVLENIMGGVSNIHSRDIKLTFNKEIQVLSSYAIPENDEIIVSIPSMKMNDSLSLVCKFPDDMSNEFITCKYVSSFDDSEQMVTSQKITLPDTLRIHFVNRRYLLQSLDSLHLDDGKSNIQKYNDYQQLKNDIKVEDYGEYYAEMNKVIDTYIASYAIYSPTNIPGYRPRVPDANVANTLASIRNTSESLRQPSSSLARTVTDSINNANTSSIIEEDFEEE